MADSSLFDASPHLGIALGTCVMLEGGDICYAGPIKLAPDSANKLVLLHPEDFDKLKAHVEKRRH